MTIPTLAIGNIFKMILSIANLVCHILFQTNSFICELNNPEIIAINQNDVKITCYLKYGNYSSNTSLKQGDKLTSKRRFYSRKKGNTSVGNPLPVLEPMI